MILQDVFVKIQTIIAKKAVRINVGLICTKCGASNYTTEKNKQTTTEALRLNKFCPQCGNKVEHKEKKKLH